MITYLMMNSALSMSMQSKIVQSMQRPMTQNLLHSRKKFSSDEIMFMWQTTHIAMLSVNTYGLYQLTAPTSVPAHTAAIVLGVTSSTPETIIAAGVLTTLGFINDDRYKKDNKISTKK